MAKTLVSELEAGDPCLYGNWQAKVDRVELRTLYAQVSIPRPGGAVDVQLKRFWRDTGRTVGERSSFKLRVATDAATAEATDARRRRELIFALKDYEHWELTPTEALERVAEILKVAR